MVLQITLDLTPSRILWSLMPGLHQLTESICHIGVLSFRSSDMLRYELFMYAKFSLTWIVRKCEGNINRSRWEADDAPNPLTTTGRHQADSLGRDWADARIDHLLSSPNVHSILPKPCQVIMKVIQRSSSTLPWWSAGMEVRFID